MEKNISEEVIENYLNISEEELPNVISDQFQKIIEIDKAIKAATENCEIAKSKAEKMICSKFGNDKKAINSTQDVVKSIADAQISLGIAQKVLFENQQKMADGMRYLLIIGASSIAINKAVVTSIKLKLKQASQEELSEATRKELIRVIKLLREQEDAFSKQDRMSEKIDFIDKEIESIHLIDEQQNEKDEEHDKSIAQNKSINDEQANQIEKLQKKANKQDESLKQIKIISIISGVVALASCVLSVIALIIK